MNIGLFGGTFNPFHNGHFEIINHVRAQFAFDRVILIPSFQPPHKPGDNLAPADVRFEMVQSAVSDVPGFLVSDKELNRKGPSFTIDTINEFKSEAETGTRFFLLMGSDAFLDISAWERKDQIFETIDIIIMLRRPWDDPAAIVSFIDETISKGYTFKKDGDRFVHSTRRSIHLCDVPRIDISSSMIRKMIRENKSIRDLVPASVNEIIQTKELYQ